MSNIVNSKKLVNFRLSEEDLKKLDILSEDLTKEIKIKFDRTMTLEYCIRWEFDKKYGTNKINDYIEHIKEA